MSTDECAQRAWICLRERKGLLLAAGSGNDDASDNSRQDHWLAGHQNAALESSDFLIRRMGPGTPHCSTTSSAEGNQAHDHFVASPIFQSGTLLDYHPSENSDVATPLPVSHYLEQGLVLRFWAFTGRRRELTVIQPVSSRDAICLLKLVLVTSYAVTCSAYSCCEQQLSRSKVCQRRFLSNCPCKS